MAEDLEDSTDKAEQLADEMEECAEIDFLVQYGGYIIPIEVKAEENLRAKSLRNYCRRYQLEIAVRSSMSRYRREEWMTNVPLYALADYIKGVSSAGNF